MVKRIIALLVAVLLTVGLIITANAVSVPDLSKNGSLTIHMRWMGEPLNGGNLNLYKVGDVVSENGNYQFELIEELQIYDLDLSDVEDPDLAERLLSIATVERLPRIREPIRNGVAEFEDLEPGLYLVWQSEEDATKGYYPILPFLISIPRCIDGEYFTDVKAFPKVPIKPTPTCPTDPTCPTQPTCPTEPSCPTQPTCPSEPTKPSEPTEPSDPTKPSDPTEPSDPTKPSEPTKPSDPTKPSEPDDPTDPTEPDEPQLPQTGQLNWPVPVMAMGGALLLILGFLLRVSSKKRSSDA